MTERRDDEATDEEEGVRLSCLGMPSGAVTGVGAWMTDTVPPDPPFEGREPSWEEELLPERRCCAPPARSDPCVLSCEDPDDVL